MKSNTTLSVLHVRGWLGHWTPNCSICVYLKIILFYLDWTGQSNKLVPCCLHFAAPICLQRSVCTKFTRKNYESMIHSLQREIKQCPKCYKTYTVAYDQHHLPPCTLLVWLLMDVSAPIKNLRVNLSVNPYHWANMSAVSHIKDFTPQTTGE